MKLLKKWLADLIHVLDLITLSQSGGDLVAQQPLVQPSTLQPSVGILGSGPVFQPPNPEGNLKCNYTLPSGWKGCNTPQNRECWLRGPNGGEFNITTNYEMIAPNGTLRKYELHVTNMTLAPDGFKNTEGKVFNNAYPGPWIQACWGDDIEIKVTNYLTENGTTIHWHGIRQNGTLDMDGVNGVTQCPIATNDSFTYKFKATQYGTSWYHSHYSLQYADGLLGPMTIYGPSSANYDEAIPPILMTDWSHRSAFQDLYVEMNGSKPTMTSALMAGRGFYNCTETEVKIGNCTTPPAKYNTTFEEGKKYLLRIINTSVDSTWIFSIDNHLLQIVGSDFVPIHPYKKNHLLVGIGQRYHIIVEATRPLPDDNYWIRMRIAKGCSGFGQDKFKQDIIPEERMGILRYNNTNKDDPNTTAHEYGKTCADEPYENLKPILPWKIGKPSNEQEYNTFEVGFSPKTDRPPWGKIARWQMGKHPLWLDFSNPTIVNLQTRPNETYWESKPDLAVISESNANTAESWIYLLITATKFPFSGERRIDRFIPAAHPIHLHGHDFAILKQSKTPYWSGLVDMNFDNPPRRDVALLPAGGYLIIAFKADNPGSWLLHCHIAWHASSGLALQIMERELDIHKTISPARMEETKRVCGEWKKWSKKHNLTQDDSGI